jgi:hypothetical protein
MNASPPAFSRRTVLRAGGALAVGFALPLRASAASEVAGRTVAPDQVDGFIVIDAQDGITLYSGKVELGTGVLTALT